MRPILVTGSHRSGSTWVGRMLAASKDVGYISEPFSLNHRPGICGAAFRHQYTYITHENEAAFRPHLERTLRFRYGYLDELRALPASWSGARKRGEPDTSRGHGPRQEPWIRPALPMPRPARHLVKDGAQFSWQRLTKARPLVKDPIALFASEWLARTFEMDVVVLIRHPAAFASSLKRLDWKFPFSHFLEQPLLMRDHLEPFRSQIESFVAREHDILDQAALLWRIIHFVISELRRRHSEWIFLRHEDLSSEPVRAFRDLYGRLGLEYSPDVEATVRAHSGESNPSEAPSGEADFLRRDSRSNIQNWRRRLTAAEVERVRIQVDDVAGGFYSDADW